MLSPNNAEISDYEFAKKILELASFCYSITHKHIYIIYCIK